jgi:uncharacterized protein YybS (DUF2232 family)
MTIPSLSIKHSKKMTEYSYIILILSIIIWWLAVVFAIIQFFRGLFKIFTATKDDKIDKEKGAKMLLISGILLLALGFTCSRIM